MDLVKKIRTTLFPNQKEKLVKAINITHRDLVMLRAEIGEKIFNSDDYDADQLFVVLSSLKQSEKNLVKAETDNKKKLVDNLKDDEDGKLKYVDKMKDSYGKKREEMPQIESSNLADFLLHFGDKVGVKKVTRKLHKLKPCQDEINEDKVYGCLASKFDDDADSTPRYIISNDNYILDGHHRWASDLELDTDETKDVDCYKIDLPIKRLLYRANKMKITKKKDINDVEKSYLPTNFENGEEFETGEELMKAFSPDFINHILYEHRPAGIPDQQFQESVKILSDVVENNSDFATIVKGQTKTHNLKPIKRNVLNTDNTIVPQIFWVQNNDTMTKRPIVISDNSGQLFRDQKIAEQKIKLDDNISGRFIGSVSGNKYEVTDGFKVINIKPDTIVVELTKAQDNQLQVGDTFELPKTTSPFWSEYQNFNTVPETELEN